MSEPDRAAAELADAELMLAERMLRDLPPDKVISTVELAPLVEVVLAELDRQRALIAAVLAECDRREKGAMLRRSIDCDDIRALLGGEGR